MIFFKFAFRNFLRQKRRSLLTITTMAIGFLFLSVSIGLSKGSYIKIIDVFTKQKVGHLQIHKEDYLFRPSLYKNLTSKDFDKLKNFSFIKSYAPRVNSSALAFSKEKAVGAAIIGIDFKKEFNTTLIEKKLSEGAFTKDGVVISYGLKKVLGVDIGEELVLISQGADGSISNDIFTISGIYGNKDDIQNLYLCYMEIKNAQEFLSLGEKFHEIAIMTDSYAKAPIYAEILNNSLNDNSLDIKPWQVIEKAFYDAMQADIKGMWLSLFIIMLIVSMGVLNTVLMVLLERKKEYGIMKALGSTPKFLFFQILSEMLFLAFLASIIGFIFAFISNLLLKIYGIPLKNPLEFGGVKFYTYESHISLDSYLIPFVLIIFTTIIITIIPAISTAKKKAISSIRTN